MTIEKISSSDEEVKLVGNTPVVKVRIVNSFPDVKMKLAESFPGERK